MQTIHAVFEKGVFRPIEAVDLAENTEVEIELRLVSPRNGSRNRKAIYDVLSTSFETSETDLAARHDEHQLEGRHVLVSRLTLDERAALEQGIPDRAL